MQIRVKKVLSPSLAALASLLILAACAANPPKEPDANPSPAIEQKVELKEPDPANAEALYDYAAALERNGDEAKALSYYLQATQVNPDYVKAHVALAQLYVKFNRMDEARVAYENILRLDRDNPFVAQYKEARLKYYSALNIAQNDEYDKALKLLAQAPRNTPLDREIEEIESKWKQNLQASSNQKAADDIIQQASLLAYKGQYTQAIELIKTAPDSGNNDKVLAKIAQWEKALQDRSSVQPIGPDGTTPPAANTATSGPTKYVASDNVNVRQSPYLYAQSLSVANRGTPVEILQDKAYESDGYRWTKIKTRDGQIGWVADSFLVTNLSAAPTQQTPLPSTPQQTATATDSGQSYGQRTINGDQVNVRSLPSLNGTLVTRAARGTDVTLLSSGAVAADGYNWYKVRLPDNQVGWVASGFLGTARLVAPPSVNGSSTPATTSTPKSPSPAANATSNYRYISGSGINMRSSASTSASIVSTLNQGDRVALTSSKVVKAGGYNWVSIATSDGKRGWVATNFLNTAAPKSAPAAPAAASTSRIVRGSDVNIRVEANTGAKIILVAQEGTRVTLMSSKLVTQGGHTWAKVRLSNGQLGWVVADYLGR